TDARLSSTLQRNVPARSSVAARVGSAGVRRTALVAATRGTALAGVRRTTLVAARWSRSVGVRSAGSAVGRACRTSFIRGRLPTSVGARSAGRAIGRAARGAGFGTTGRSAGLGTTGRAARLGTTGRAARLGTAARGGFRRRLARSRRTLLVLLSRSHCGYREKDQQYGPNRQDVLSSVARIH